MLAHHVQRTIVLKLALARSLTFSQLKPADMDNKGFMYHLNLLIKDGIVKKSPLKSYSLTAKGRKLGVSVGETLDDIVSRAYSLLFLVVRRKSDGAWLLYRRKNHPLLGKVGFMHTRPLMDEKILDTACRALLEKTGLSGSFIYRFSGFSRVFLGLEPESFIHFSLLFCADAAGDLAPNDPYADYFWDVDPDFANMDMLPNMIDLVKHIELENSEFFEEFYQLGEA